MPNNQSSSVTQEIRRHAVSGWLMLPVNIILLIVGIAVLTWGIMIAANTRHFSYLIIAGPIIETTAIILLCGHFTLQPNEARVLILFGAYHGTVRDSGFFWANPFYSRVRGRIPRSAAERGRDRHTTRSPLLHAAMAYRSLSA